jgi:competence protein ComEC
MSADASSVIYRPLIPVTLTLLAGIGLGAFCPGRVLFVSVVALICALIVLALVLTRRPAIVLPLLFCAAVGYLLPQPWLAARLSENHVSRFADQQQWRITGTIRDRPHVQSRRAQFSLAAERLQRGNRDIAVRGNIRVTVGGKITGLRRGDPVTFSGRLKPIRNFNNPGRFDYVRFMSLDDTRVRTYTAGERILNSAPFRSADEASPINGVRDGILNKMETALAGRSPDAVALLAALIVGERGALRPELREAFNRSGMAHLLAISGLHVGMVAAVVFGLSAWCLAWLPPLLRRAWTRRVAAACAFLAVLAYGVLAGLSPATQRALVMSSAALLTFWVNRRHDWGNALAVAALIILLVMPPVVLGPSFQLSFAAVLAILGGSSLLRPAVPEADDSWALRTRRRLTALVWVSLLATLGTLPLVMYYFNQVSLVGPAANIVAVPAVGCLVLPAGLLGVVFSFFSPALAALCWQVAALTLEALLILVHTIAAWPPAAIKTITPTIVEIALWAGVMMLAFNWRHRRLRIATLTILLIAIALDVGYWTQRRFDRHRLTVQVIDVGQGSANLLQLPGGYTVLIDGGGFGDNEAFDVGKLIVAPFLWRQKIKTVDLVVSTHTDSDHLNGLLYILEHFNVGEVWSNQEPCAVARCRKWQEIIQRRKITHPPFGELALETERKGVRFVLLNPPLDFLTLGRSERWRNANNNSLVLQVAWGGTSFLFTGDIGQRAEADILKRQRVERLRSTILIVPHHGSRTSCSQAFLEAVRPHEAIIPAGWDNRYGFPHPLVLERLDKMECRTWRTDLYGAVRIVTNGKTYEAKGFQQPPGS